MIFSNFWDSYFSSYGEFGEFSLRFTAPLSGRSLSNKAAHHITAKIGDAGCIRLHVCSTLSKSPSWSLDQPGTVSGQRTAYASGPTLRDRRDDEQRGSPHDAKCNVAEIGAVNMGEIGAEPGRSTLNVLNYKYKYFPSRKYLSTSTLLFGEMYLSTFRVLSKCTFKEPIYLRVRQWVIYDPLRFA